MSRPKAVTRLALRDQISKVDRDIGCSLGDVGPGPRKEMLRLELVEMREVADETRLFLTPAGEAFAEIAGEWLELLKTCDRMRDSVVNGILETKPSKSAAPAHFSPTKRAELEKPAEGSFLDRLNAAGLNSWSLNPQHGRNAK